MVKKRFTQNEIEKLEKNPNTLFATETRLYLTEEAKEKVLALIYEGKTAYQITKQLGYDPGMLGEARYNAIRYHVLKENEEGHKQREVNHNRRSKRMTVEEIEDLPLNQESLNRMKNELIYLRQEVDFLKKISQLARSEKRGD